MGKTNKGQRTKGNTRPSSSVQSAQLLNSCGRTFSGFVGFEALEKETTACYVPVTGQPEDTNIDSDFRMVMRKMIKRDALTKLKAVQEFGDYCMTKDVETVRSVLPFWPRLFNKLALDSDRRIREATHCTNGKLLEKVHREFAPYLRNVIGVWLLGQCDSYAPSASAAQTAFEATFPPAKRSQVLIYCKTEIFSYFKENLFDSSKATNKANSSNSEDLDLENKQNLILASTLLALKYVLSNVLPKEISSIEDNFCDIISEAKFWNILKHKDAQVRSSWYAFLSALCSSKMGILPKIEKKMSSVVISCLSEKDPVTSTVAWEAALHIVFHLQTCWDGVDVQRKVFPQLWSFLQEGGRGNANALYPCLLPLISKFPREILESSSFQLQFISYLHDSLSLDSVKNSRTECDAIVKAYIECFQYFCCNFEENETILMEKVLIQQVLPLVESSIYAKEYFHLSTSKFYPLLRSLLNKIEQVSEKSGSTSNALTLFWDKLLCITSKFYTRKKSEMDTFLVHFTRFFQGMFNPMHSNVEKAHVRFSDEKLENNETSELPMNSCGNVASLKKDSPSLKYVLKSSKFLSEKLSKNFDIHALKLLKELFMLTFNQQHFNEFLTLVCDIEKDAVYEFLNDKVLKWVISENRMGFDSIVDIVFCVCHYIHKEDSLKVLHTCCEVQDIVFFQKLLNKGRLYIETNPFKCWLIGSEWMDIIMKHLRTVICVSQDSETVPNDYLVHLKDLLNFCFSDPVLKELLAKEKKHENFFSLCVEFFNYNSESVLPQCSKQCLLICQVMSTLLENFTICWKDSAADLILSHLFRSILLSEAHFEGELSKEAWTLWNLAVKNSVNHQEKQNFILKTASELHSLVISLSNETQYKFISRLVENFLCSLHLETQSDGDLYLNIQREMLEIILPSESELAALQDGVIVSLIPSFVENLIFYPPLNENSSPSLQIDKIKKFILITKLTCLILSNEKYSTKNKEFFIESILLKRMPFLMWALNFCNGNGYINQALLIELKHDDLISSCTSLLLSLPIQYIDKVLFAIFHKSLCNESSWVSTLQTSLCIAEKIHYEFQSTLLEMLSSVDTTDDYGFAAVQIVLHHIQFDKKREMLTSLYEEFIIALKEHGHVNKKCLLILAKICCISQDKNFYKSNKGCDISRDVLMSVAVLPEEENILLNLQATSILFNLNESSRIHLTSKKIWNFSLNILKSCLQKAKIENYDKGSSLLLLHQVASLARILFISVNNISPAPVALFPPEFSPAIDEQLYKDFILLFIHLSESGVQYSHMFKAFEKVMSTVCDALESIPGPLLLDMLLKNDVTVYNKGMLQCLTSALSSQILLIQYGAHKILLKILALLPANLISNKKDDDEQDFKIPARLSPLLDLAHFSNEIIENMLSDIKIGDCCIVVPHTDSYCFSMSYLFVWLEILEFISSSQTQLRAAYVEDLEEKNLLPALFSSIFCLMPENPVEFAQDSSQKDGLIPLFLHHPKLLEGSTPEQIQHFACYVFATALCKIPATMRTWFNNLDKKSSEVVNRFTSKYISNILITQEIQAVHENETQFENMTVHARPGSREVSAIYTVDDCPIELCLKLPVNFPLGQVITEKRGKVVVAQQEWRHWHMQLTTVLTYQNGSILDGLTIWKRNLDKKFEDIEECMICYYILHNSTLKLPKLSCHVCRKRFHSDCLYKWFRTSNNSTCPLCRNEFIM